MVPVDFSPISPKVIGIAAALAAKFSAQLLLVHVVQSPDYPAIGMLTMKHYPNLHDEVRRQCVRELAELRQGVSADIVSTSAVLEGTPFQCILDHAREHKVDMIVMGPQGRTGLQHLMLGSTAERVVRLASCPVLTIGAAAV